MNSILQCLFHLNEFRDAIFKINIPKGIKNVVNALNNLFKELLINNNQQYINPESFFNLYDGDNLQMNVQRDAEGFFLELLDKLEISLKDTTHENINKYFFQVSIISKFISIKCNHNNFKEDYIFTVDLDIKNKKTIFDSLNDYIKPEILVGENALFCEKCNKYIKCKKNITFKILPRLLMFVLKRFEYNINQMVKKNWYIISNTLKY